MTRKHYVGIANILADILKIKGVDTETLNLVALHLADYMENQNALFDRHAFLTAVGVRYCGYSKGALHRGV